MKVKLIIPPRLFSGEDLELLLPPLSISLLASHLRKNKIDVEMDDLDIKTVHDKELYEAIRLSKELRDGELVDLFLLEKKKNKNLFDLSEKIIKKIPNLDFNLFGFSLIESSGLNLTLILAKRIKEITGAKIVFGGGSTDYDLLKKYPFIDFLVYGKGELALLDLCNHILGKREIKDVHSIIYRKNGDILSNKKNSLRLENSPIPDFKTINLNFYTFIPITSHPFKNPNNLLVLPYNFIDGCPFRCSFCGESSVPPGPKFVEKKSNNKIITELNELSKTYKTPYFLFLNNFINLNYNFIDSLCDELIKNDLKFIWSDSARANFFDEKLLNKMRLAGCVSLTFGIESGSDKTLERMNKQIKSINASEILKQAHEAGIWNCINIIVGFPLESEEDFNQTFDFIKNNIDYIDQLYVSKFRLSSSEVLLNPKKFGIELINENPVGKEKNSNLDVFCFNEIDGLKWEDREKQSQIRLNKLQSFFNYKKGNTLGGSDGLYTLYYLYDKLKTKKEVKNWITHKLRKESIIHIGYKCNNNCDNCNPLKSNDSFKEKSFEKIIEEINHAKRFGRKKIILKGGEPTIRTDLFKIIKHAKSIGFNQIEIISNYRMLYYEDYASRLKKYGLTNILKCLDLENWEEHNLPLEKNYVQSLRGLKNWKEIKNYNPNHD